MTPAKLKTLMEETWQNKGCRCFNHITKWEVRTDHELFGRPGRAMAKPKSHLRYYSKAVIRRRKIVAAMSRGAA